MEGCLRWGASGRGAMEEGQQVEEERWNEAEMERRQQEERDTLGFGQTSRVRVGDVCGWNVLCVCRFSNRPIRLLYLF